MDPKDCREHFENPERAQLESNLFSLRGLALAVLFGGTGPLLAQQ